MEQNETIKIIYKDIEIEIDMLMWKDNKGNNIVECGNYADNGKNLVFGLDILVVQKI